MKTEIEAGNPGITENFRPSAGASYSASHIGSLYEDSRWKEECLSRLEIILDDHRNACGDFSVLGDVMEYGETYRITLTIEKIEDALTSERKRIAAELAVAQDLPHHLGYRHALSDVISQWPEQNATNTIPTNADPKTMNTQSNL
jgi:hypothetical protein